MKRAIQACEAALRQRPAEPEALHLTATIHASAGDLRAALDCARKAVTGRPGDMRYMHTLGRLLNATGRPGEAEPVFRALIEKDATFAGARQGLAAALQLQSRGEDALAVLARASQELGHAGLLREYAQALVSLDRLEEAASQLEKALAIAEDDAIALNNLGSIRLRQGRVKEALVLLQEALRLDPDDATAIANLGLAYRADGRLQDALRCFDGLRERRALTAGERAAQASVLLSLGRRDEALSGFNDALDLDADQPQALAGKAELLEWEGEYEAGLALLRDRISNKDCDALLLLAAARLLRRLDRADEAIGLLESCLQRSALDGALRRAALFTLGGLYDQAGRFDDAFSRIREAHTLNTRHFDMDGHRRWVTQTITTWSSQRISELPRAEDGGPAPIFIVGMPRSGTSLVEQILASHPSVHAGGERDDVGQMARKILPRLSGEGGARPTQAEFTALARDYVGCTGTAANPAARITDKMPLNFLYLGLIGQLFPNARILHCRRAPLDTALSCYFTDFIDPALAFSERLEDIAKYYKEYERLMAHWRAVLHLPVHDVVYEDLVREQEKSTRALVTFADLSWDDRCLRFHESRRSVHTASHAQVRRPIYASSIGRSAHYLEHIAPLREQLGA